MRNHSRAATLIALAAVALTAGCGDSDSDSPPAQTATVTRTATPSATPSSTTTPRTVFGGDRPVTLQVPSTYDASHPVPLLIVLHGYGADGAVQEQYLRLAPLVESEGILAAAPDGTVDRTGSRFWNATNACCNFFRSGVDDVAYIRGLIADIRHDYNVDSRRIYLAGHSNGAFMSHRLACEAASEIAAIVSLAGATFSDPTDCTPSEPVSVLDIHGDVDDTIDYNGGQTGALYPSELVTMNHWQMYDQCQPTFVTDPQMLDVERVIPGNETQVQRFNGCARGTGVELWTIHGGGHIPSLARDFGTRVWQWLMDHPKS